MTLIQQIFYGNIWKEAFPDILLYTYSEEI